MHVSNFIKSIDKTLTNFFARKYKAKKRNTDDDNVRRLDIWRSLPQSR